MPRLNPLPTTGRPNPPANRTSRGTARTQRTLTFTGRTGAVKRTTLPAGDDIAVVSVWLFLRDNATARMAWGVVLKTTGGWFRHTTERVEDSLGNASVKVKLTGPESVVHEVETTLRLWSRPVLLKTEYAPCAIPGGRTELARVRDNGPDHRPEDRYLNKLETIEGTRTGVDRFGGYGPRGKHQTPIGKSGLSENR